MRLFSFFASISVLTLASFGSGFESPANAGFFEEAFGNVFQKEQNTKEVATIAKEVTIYVPTAAENVIVTFSRYGAIGGLQWNAEPNTKESIDSLKIVMLKGNQRLIKAMVGGKVVLEWNPHLKGTVLDESGKKTEFNFRRLVGGKWEYKNIPVLLKPTKDTEVEVY